MISDYSIAFGLTIFTAILVPIYWHHYGVENFLWLSDIGLFLTVMATLLSSSLLISIATIMALPMELAWNIDFFIELFTGRSVLQLAHYMFETEYPLYLRALSLFHIFMPLLWIWYLKKWGYNPAAFKYALIMLVVVIVSTYIFTDPTKNINWVFMPYAYQWEWISSLQWMLLLLAILIIGVVTPMHLLLKHF